MAIPAAPEKISIKRRRTDEPVDHLLYQSKKQRVTDHVFVRVQPSTGLPISQPSNVQPLTPQSIPGIPKIKTTQPGDEITDFYKYKALQDRHLKLLSSTEPLHEDLAPEPIQLGDQSKQIRQFHLTRDLSTTIRPQFPGPRKSKTSLRPHLATFVERSQFDNVKLEQILVKPPIDRMIRSKDGESLSEPPVKAEPAEKRKIATFQQDHSTTDEDALADELAAMAVEMDDQLDPEVKATFLKEQQIEKEERVKARAQADIDRMQLDEYVFETYVRMKRDDVMDWTLTSENQSFGYLVIDEEEEDLWQQYLNDENDSDDEWDEEDEDSNAEDNPRNEYPDEELSSDDEYGNAYKYRNYGSDNEQYDLED